MPDRLLIDQNVMLDVLLERMPHFTESALVVELIAEDHVEGFVSGASVDTMAYLLATHHTSARINGILRFVRLKFKIAPVTESIIDDSLAAGWNDVEDSIVYQSAKSAGCTVVITRNVKDFKTKGSDGPLVMTPKEYLTLRSTQSL
jgi:predicted nucleic acid-binding protein